MQPEELIEKGAQAIRSTKYQSGGNQWRRELPVSTVDKRYAATVMITLLRDLADMRIRLDPQGLMWWAMEIEKAADR